MAARGDVSCFPTASEGTVLRRVLNRSRSIRRDEHLSRLQQWGLSFIRLVIPWESLEHAGPYVLSPLPLVAPAHSLAFGALRGQYDEAYISYLHELISMMPRYGITCYIDPHQDVWSRHTGGSGAPTWTLELVGFDIYNLKSTGAAHAHNVRVSPPCRSLHVDFER